jgi:hypothetical protein
MLINKQTRTTQNYLIIKIILTILIGQGTLWLSKEVS